VGFFTPSLNLTGETDVILTFDRNFQEYNGQGVATVKTYSGGTTPAHFEEELLYLDEEDPDEGIRTILAFDPSGYNQPDEVYIEFFYNIGGTYPTWEFGIDNVCVASSFDVYSSSMTVDLPPFDPAERAFPDTWNAAPGYYLTRVTTSLAGDENPDNDVVSATAGVFDYLVDVALFPDAPPVVVFDGGSFTFSGTLTSPPGGPSTTDVWIYALTPGGLMHGPLRLSDAYRPFSYRNIEVRTYSDIVQGVPVLSPAGVYQYIVYCGEYPNFAHSTASFEVTVVPRKNEKGLAGQNMGFHR
jgi:hypothetical protein